MSSRRGNQAMNTIYVELPPFSPTDTGAGRPRNSNRSREGRATQAEPEYVNVNHSGEEDQQDDNGVVQLSTENPFAPGGGRGSAPARRGGAPVSRRGTSPPPPPRGSSGRRQYSEPEQDEDEDEDEDEEGQEGGTSRNGITILPAFNPLAHRGGTRGRGRGGNPGRSSTAAQRQGRESPPPRTSSRRYQSEQDEEEGEEDALDDIVPLRRSNTGARTGTGRNTSPTPPTRNRQSGSPAPPSRPNPSIRNHPPAMIFSASEDEDEDAQEGQEQEEQERGPTRRVTVLEPPAEPEMYSDGEPTPVLSAVGPNTHLTRPTGRMVTAVQKAKMVSALGGNKPAAGPTDSQGSSRPNTKLTTAVQKTKMLGALGLGGNKPVLSASTDPSDLSPVHGDKGKQAAEGNRGGPSGIRNEPVHLHGSNVPLKRSETERVYVPFGEEVIRDVGRPGRRPKFPFPGYPGYPPYYPYPYPFEGSETEYIDVSGDEREHHHHDRHHPHDRHHHHEHGRHPHPHHLPYYPPPWAPVPNNPYNPYNSYNPAPPSHHRAPFVGPLYANIPPLPSLFDQARSAFYTLPVPPTTLLRDLQEAHDRQVPPEQPPSARTAPNPADLQLFLKGFEDICKSTDLLAALPVLTYQECQSFYVDAVFRRLSDIVQVRFAERRGDDIINRVHVVQRNRLAYGTVMQYRPKLDVDLVLPGNYVLRRWALDPKTPPEEKPRTIAKAFKLDTATIARGEIDAGDLQWVINAVLEQLDGRQDQFIFPGGNSEALKYIGTFDTSETKDGVNRIRLKTTADPNLVRVNVFVKVAVEVNGQEMVVGVDQASAVSAGKYQMVKLIRRPNGPLGESPLSPIERSAIIALGWWKRGVAQGDVPSKSPPGQPKLRASHFSIALKALHALDPSDELYVPHARMKARQFSMGLVVEVMLKVVKFLKLAYTSPVAVAAAATNAPSGSGTGSAGTGGMGKSAEYLFPLSSCGIMEALYTQVASKPKEIDTIVGSGVMDDLITLLEGKLPSGAKASASTSSASSSGGPGPGPLTSASANVAGAASTTATGNVQTSVGSGGNVAGGVSGTVSQGGVNVAGGLGVAPDGTTTLQLGANGPGGAFKTTLGGNPGSLGGNSGSTAAPGGTGGATNVVSSGPVKEEPETAVTTTQPGGSAPTTAPAIEKKPENVEQPPNPQQPTDSDNSKKGRPL